MKILTIILLLISCNAFACPLETAIELDKDTLKGTREYWEIKRDTCHELFLEIDNLIQREKEEFPEDRTEINAYKAEFDILINKLKAEIEEIPCLTK